MFFDGFGEGEFGESTFGDSFDLAVELAGLYDVTGEIDTSNVDYMRQGVELQLPKHFVQGVVKIWSGFPDHKLPQLEFGELETPVEGLSPFDERQKLDPVQFVRAGDQRASFETFPVPIDLIDGALDPFGSRDRSRFGFPRDPKGTRGTLMSGNEDDRGNADVVSSDHDSPPKFDSIDPFYDDPSRTNVYFYQLSVPLRPKRVSVAYSDNLSPNPGLVMPASSSNEFYVARSALVPGDFLLSRVPTGRMSAGAGFTYDSAPAGTDSLAFGGLTHG